METTVYTLTYNDDSGVRSEVFSTIEPALKAMRVPIAHHWQSHLAGEEMPSDPREAQSLLCECSGYMDSYTIEAHGVDVAAQTVPIWSLAMDGKDGTEALMFGSEAEVEEYIWQNCVSPYSHTDPDYDTEACRAEFSGDWSEAREAGHWKDFLTISIDYQNVQVPDPSGQVRDLRGALSLCVHEIEQMRGMFDDDDGNIEAALDAAQDALQHDIPKPSRVIAVFGEVACKIAEEGGKREEIKADGELRDKQFDTAAEARAYLWGLKDHEGWLEHSILQEMPT